MTGFRLSWRIENPTANQEDWKHEEPNPEYEQPLSEMVQLARQLRLQNMTKKEILEAVIHKKVKNIQILEEKGICSTGQVKPENQMEACPKLVSNKNASPFGDNDILSFKNFPLYLFSTAQYVPFQLI